MLVARRLSRRVRTERRLLGRALIRARLALAVALAVFVTPVPVKMAALFAALVPLASARSYTYRGDTPSSKLSGQCVMPGQVAMASSYCCSPRQDLLLLSKQDCEEACSADDNCVAFSWKQELPLTLQL